MSVNQSGNPAEILKNILNNLRSAEAVNRLNAIAQLGEINYSSEAIRNELETLAVKDGNETVRKAALAALDSATQRNVRSRINKLAASNRFTLLNEIRDWESIGLLDQNTAAVLRKRYDFDNAPPPAPPRPVSVQPAAALSKPEAPIPSFRAEPKVQALAKAESIPPLPPKTPVPTPVNSGPRPTLLQTLLSETSIKIALYLGAFFVIASAAILAAVSPAARLPILILATVIFGVLAVVIRKRLPQPSFALFIVFSFLLPITANVIAETLHFSRSGSAWYWVFISTLMALIWGGGTWLYESRVFSITAYLASISAFVNIGRIFESEPEFYIGMMSLAALAGLAFTPTLKRWKEWAFAWPLFLAAQIVQVAVLGASMALFLARLFDPSGSTAWNLASSATWGLAFVFYVFSNSQFPFILFPWLAASALLPIPWFISLAFDWHELPAALVSMVWGMILSAFSEATNRRENSRVFSLPVLVIAIPTFAIAIVGGFYLTSVGLSMALSTALVFGALHLIRPRGWLWTLALFNFIIAYFAFFALPTIEKLNIFAGYPLLLLSLIFLMPDLFLKADLSASRAWRFPPRILGAFFSLFNFTTFALSGQEARNHTAIIFGVYAVFLTMYALRYNLAALGFSATAALAISLTHGLHYYNLDLWLPALTVLSLFYFFGGLAMRQVEPPSPWRTVLEASGLLLGSVISLTAAFTLKEHGGWFIAVTGLLFIIQMYSRNQGIFEAGGHLFLALAAYLILLDFNIIESTYTLMVPGLIILGLDLIFSRTFHHPRPLTWSVRGLGAVLVFITSLALIGERDLQRISICFSILAIFFLIYTLVQRKAIYGYIPAAYIPLAVFHTLAYFKLDLWLPSLITLAVLYYLAGIWVKARETQRGPANSWSEMMRLSGLALGTLVSIYSFSVEKEFAGYFILGIVIIFTVEMFLRANGWLEAGPQFLATIAVFLILNENRITEIPYYFLAFSSAWLGFDLFLYRIFKHPRPLAAFIWAGGGIATIANLVLLLDRGIKFPGVAAFCFGVYTLLFLLNVLVRKMPVLGYLPAGFLSLTIHYWLGFHKLDLWLPVLMALAVLYFGSGLLVREKKEWGEMLRNCALALGSILCFNAMIVTKEFSGWYMIVVAALFIVEMFVRRESLFEAGAQIFLSTAAFMILRDLNITNSSYIALAAGLTWLGLDVGLHKTYLKPRVLAWPIRIIAGVLALGNAGYLLFRGIDEPRVAMFCFGLYAVFFIIYSLLYQQPVLGYSVTLSFVLSLVYSMRAFHWNEWFLPIAAVSALYYTGGRFLQKDAVAELEGPPVTWGFVLWTSGIGVGIITSVAAPLKGGLSAAIPAAVTATMVSLEAYRRRNVWLGFPANAFYLLSYFILLRELSVDEPQFFSMGAALLGMIQHYLLSRAASRKWAFLMGMVSQLVLLGTTYIQMLHSGQLTYFFVLFLQSMAVLLYGVIIRSRSLTITPMVIVVIGVITVLYSVLKSISTVVLIGCTGVILLLLGILAVIMRERITKLGESLSDWRP